MKAGGRRQEAEGRRQEAKRRMEFKSLLLQALITIINSVIN
jgi:hypothetical protein